MKIIVIRYNAGIVTNLSFSYDNCRRGFLCGGSVTKKFKKLPPAVPRRGPEAEVLRIK
jgi:hypothetical protein